MDIDKLFKTFKSHNPNPKGELEYTNGYTLLVAVVLSAQATDKGVNAATHALFKKVSTPEQMLKLGLEGLKEHIKTIGLFNTKANNIIKLSKVLVEKHGSEVPPKRELLEQLAGVGRKTANVVLNIYFNQPTIAVDTHIFRVAHRLGLSEGKTPLAVELDLEKKVPAWAVKSSHHWLILHGRYVCIARKPKCAECIVRKLCPYPDKT